MSVIDKIVKYRIPKKGKYKYAFDSYKKSPEDKYVFINQRELVKIVTDEIKFDIECICDKCGKHFTRRLGLLELDRIYCQICITKDTNQKRYGVDVPIQNKKIYEKIKNTMIERYGVDNSMKSPEVRKKSQETLMKNYGVEHPSQNKEIQERTKKTFLKKYGVECSLQNEKVKEKAKKTLIEKYGVDNSMKAPEVQEKFRKTMQERYGVNYVFENDTLYKKAKQTMLEKYGYEFAIKNKEIQEKQKITCLKHFGVEYPAQSKEVLKRQEETNLKKYGYKHPLDLAKNRGYISIENIRCACSKQQKHIAELIHGEINVPVGRYILDIVVDNINIEYDGGGHRLNVKFGVLTNEEFDKQENKRNQWIIHKGYKVIRIICPRDKIPEDDIILKQLKEAREKLKKENIIYITWD